MSDAPPSPLQRKLGVKPGKRLWVGGEAALDRLATVATPAEADILLHFVADRASVAPALAAMLPHYRRGMGLWFAYPKLSGARAGDLSRDRGWGALGDHDLLPVTQVALDADWSALRFRYRHEIPRLTRKVGAVG